MIRSSLFRWLMRGLMAAACLAATLSPAAADSDRAGKWQFHIPLTYVGSESLDGQGGSSLDVNGDLSWGFAFGYNFDERWSLGFEASYSTANYDARLAADTDGDAVADRSVRIGGVLDAGTLQITGQFNFLDRPITPFLRANAGSTYIDTNIAAGPPTGTCWWHPWYGYLCDVWQPTYSKNSLSYGAAVGVRADVADKFYLEGSINQLWIDSDRTDDLELTGYRLNVGWTF